MNCEEIRTLLDSLPLAEFTAKQLDAAENHARDCPECNRLLNAEKELDSSLRGLPDLQHPPGITAAVMARIGMQDESADTASRELSREPASEWAMWMIVAGIAVTAGVYGYELLNGRSTTFNIFSLWTDGWADWLLQPVQLDLTGLGIAAGFIVYLTGFFLMFRDRSFST